MQVLHSDFEKRPLSEQIIDQILAEDSSRYTIYQKIRMSKDSIAEAGGDDLKGARAQAIGEFMSLWIQYENQLRVLA